MPLILCCCKLFIQFFLFFGFGIDLCLYLFIDLIDDEHALQISI